MRPPAMVAVVLILATAAEASTPKALMLERAPLKGLLLRDLRELDRARHATMSVVNLSLEGSPNLPEDGLYYTTLELGNPSKKHTFQIDTGSSVPWIACKGCICTGCSTTTNNISMDLYNPESSSTSSAISCSDARCAAADKSGSAICPSSTGMCGYDITYGDRTRVSGYYVSDTIHFDTTIGNQQSASSASVVFGCTKSLSHVMKTDGLLGFARNPLSIVSQLNSQGVSPKVFSQCLKGSEEGGGILVLGEIVVPGLVFSPLVSSKPSYNLNLESIAVNGRNLPIDSSLFATSNSQGTVVDSGTTLSYLVDGAYTPLIAAIDAARSPSVQSLDVKWNGKAKCYLSSNSVDMLFPTVTLYFKGGAAMTVKPSQYLLQQGSNGNGVWWCIGWQSSQQLRNIQGITLLGDIVLRDKIIVYDLGKSRLGWTDYNCSALSRTSSFDVSGASPYYSGLIAIGVAVVWLGGLLTH